MNSLCLVVCTVLSVVTYAAIEETENVQQSGMNSSIQSDVSSKETEKNLANEPKPRGQLLYENQCHFCHESTVHIREGHKAKNYADIQYWVGRWADELDTKWSADEIDAVVQYLNDTFYHF